jgi:hypothetical protein
MYVEVRRKTNGKCERMFGPGACVSSHERRVPKIVPQSSGFRLFYKNEVGLSYHQSVCLRPLITSEPLA